MLSANLIRANLKISEQYIILSVTDWPKQTLQHFLKILPQKKGIEKNLLIKKFIKEIIYSKQNIQISLYFSIGFEDLNFSFLGRANKKEGRKILGEFSAEDKNLMVRSIQNGSPGRARTYDPLVTPNPQVSLRSWTISSPYPEPLWFRG